MLCEYTAHPHLTHPDEPAAFGVTGQGLEAGGECTREATHTIVWNTEEMPELEICFVCSEHVGAMKKRLAGSRYTMQISEGVPVETE